MNQDVEVCAIDANVILRYLIQDHETLSPKATEIMEGIESGRTVVSFDPINLGEVVWVLGSFYKLSPERICGALEAILSLDGFLLPHKEQYIRALRLFAAGVKHFGDACACVVAFDDCEGRVYSFDQKLDGVDGIVRLESVP